MEGYIHEQKHKDMNSKNDHQVYFYHRKENNSKEIHCASSRCEMFYFCSFIVDTCSYNNLYMFMSEIFHNKNDYWKNSTK